jgi:hypothetical protein
MFMCKQCLEQFEDKDLAYTLILESRMNQPYGDAFVLKFCSKAHVQEFLSRISNQRQKYVLSKITRSGEQKFPADYPLELLLHVGSSKAS